MDGSGIDENVKAVAVAAALQFWWDKNFVKMVLFNWENPQDTYNEWRLD